MNQELMNRFIQLSEVLKKNIEAQTVAAQLQAQANQLLVGALLQRKKGVGGLPPLSVGVSTVGGIFTLDKGYTYTTDILELKNQNITGDKIIFSYEFGGGISEIILLSDDALAANAVYKVRLIADGKPIWNDTYANLALFSDYHTDMSAEGTLSAGDYYAMKLRNIFFNESINFTIYESTATFTKIYVKTIKRLENGEDEAEE